MTAITDREQLAAVAAKAAEFLDAPDEAIGVDRQIAHAGCLAHSTSPGAIPTSSA